MIRGTRGWLLALCAVAGVGCTDSPSSQVLTGRVGTTGAIAVRAVTTDSVVTAAQVRSDGTFTLALPKGKRYRLEVLTTSGVRHVFAGAGGALNDLSFDVCQPTDPYDVGGIGWGDMTPGDPGPGGGNGGGTGPGGPPTCDPNTDPNCVPPTPGCDPMTDPNCEPPTPCADPSAPNCQPPPPCDPNAPDCGICTDPMDPACWPTPCMPGDPNCEPPPPPPCMDPNDPYCACDAAGNCPPPVCDDNTTSTGTMCPPPPPPPCADPMDPETCKDPCVADPVSCGCASTDPNCWPAPQPPECAPDGTMCDPTGGGMWPDHPPGDFGCGEEPVPATDQD